MLVLPWREILHKPIVQAVGHSLQRRLPAPAFVTHEERPHKGLGDAVRVHADRKQFPGDRTRLGMSSYRAATGARMQETHVQFTSDGGTGSDCQPE